MKEKELLEVYGTVIRSATEYCSIIYHGLTPKYLMDKLESIQRQALKIIYGWNRDITEIMETKGIDTLEKRREANLLRFALKAEGSERYCNKWFKRTNTERIVRPNTRNYYEEPFCRTERMKGNPVVMMTKILNEHRRI